MAQFTTITKKWMAFLVAAVAIVCFMNYHQANSTPVNSRNNNNNIKQQQPEPISNNDDANQQPWDDGILVIPTIADCADDEENHPGAHPSCEQTCSNPMPFCIKIFYTNMDYVPCFCKKGLYRDERTKKCVPLDECPPKSRRS